MNDALIRKFCESPRRWLIVAIATVVLALASVVPLADDLCDNRRCSNALYEDLAQARQAAEMLPAFEKQVGSLTQEVQAIQSRAVDQTSLAAFRSRVVDLVRASGCQIRRIEVGPPIVRPWEEGDNAVEAVKKEKRSETPFVLERRSLTLAVDGSMREVGVLLKNLDAEATLAHPRGLRLQSASREGKRVMMEIELWLFNLARGRA